MRPDCPFMHSTQARAHKALCPPAPGNPSSPQQVADAQAPVPTLDEPVVRELYAAVLDDVLCSMVREVVDEAATAAVSLAVTRHRAGVAATLGVLEAVSVVDDGNSSYLRESIFHELERFFAQGAEARAADWTPAPALNNELARQAFEARASKERLGFAAAQSYQPDTALRVALMCSRK